MSLQKRPFSHFSILFALNLLNAHTNFAQKSINCSTFTSCGDCTSRLECGFCVKDNLCVQGSWNEPFKNSSLCLNDNWEYEYAQCFVTHKQALISLISALVGILFISILLCLCCCICRCCRIRGSSDDERTPLLGNDTLATQHFRRASFYNYNRNRPFERRGRTLSSGTVNAMQYGGGRNWRNGAEEYMYGYGAPNQPSMLWVNDTPGVPTDYAMSSHNNSLGNGEWRKWEKKREELLAKYAKNSSEC
ncbi:9427_t:CDS:2 [Funneliformis caledonium]|uniref:9427_t:CDS:1 n=2 Tax=Funneliformis TaxID=1117308 RepID=A0A9N8Z0X9_9GLOM|nr:9427_t:CDS:2 [Funneliformis caledonium]CAG8590167.1 6312_t:CDS:2 [Funneliformis mosseae]